MMINNKGRRKRGDIIEKPNQQEGELARREGGGAIFIIDWK